MRRIQGLSKGAFAALALASLVACGDGEVGSFGSQPAVETGPEAEPAATIEIVGFDDLEPALAAGRGEGQLVNFWAMWCVPCVAELPELVEVAREYRARGGRVVGISYDLMVAGSDPATIVDETRAFLSKRDLADFPVLIYDEADYDAINELFELPGEVPVTLAVDATGKVVDRQEGRAGKERFEAMMRAALGLD